MLYDFRTKERTTQLYEFGLLVSVLIVRTCIYIVANITVFIVICITIIDTYFLFPNYSHAIFMCYKFPQVICVFDYTCIRKKRFYSVCVKSNFSIQHYLWVSTRYIIVCFRQEFSYNWLFHALLLIIPLPNLQILLHN